MCYFIALGIEEKFIDLLWQSKPEVLRLKPNANQSIGRLFQPKVAFWAGTSGMCDCNFYYALAAPQNNESEEEYLSRFRQTRQKRGWSPKKIERAVAESKHVREHRAVERQITMQALQVQVSEFLSWVRELVSRVGEVILLAHEYRGRIDQEEVRVQGHLTIIVTELLERRRYIEAEHVVHLVADQPSFSSPQTQNY